MNTAYIAAPHPDHGMTAPTYSAFAMADNIEALREACERKALAMFPDDGRDHERARPNAERRKILLQRLTLDAGRNAPALFPVA